MVDASDEKEFSRYADLKSHLTLTLENFRKICEEQNRDVESEIEDCITDSQPPSKRKK